jgi:hypothetical protein
VFVVLWVLGMNGAVEVRESCDRLIRRVVQIRQARWERDRVVPSNYSTPRLNTTPTQQYEVIPVITTLSRYSSDVFHYLLRVRITELRIIAIEFSLDVFPLPSLTFVVQCQC